MDGDALKQQVASLEGSTRVGMDALLENITRLRRQLAGFALDDVIVEAKWLGWNIDVQREHFIFTAPDGEEIAISFDRLDWQALRSNFGSGTPTTGASRGYLRPPFGR